MSDNTFTLDTSGQPTLLPWNAAGTYFQLLPTDTAWLGFRSLDGAFGSIAAAPIPPDTDAAWFAQKSNTDRQNVANTPAVLFIGGNNFIFAGSDPTATGFNMEQVKGTPMKGTFIWSEATSSANHPTIKFNGSAGPFSITDDSVTVTADA